MCCETIPLPVVRNRYPYIASACISDFTERVREPPTARMESMAFRGPDLQAPAVAGFDHLLPVAGVIQLGFNQYPVLLQVLSYQGKGFRDEVVEVRAKFCSGLRS